MNEAIGITIDAIAGLVRSVQGAAQQTDGLWVGAGNAVSYTVLVKLPEGEAELAGLKPANRVFPAAVDIVAQSPGTSVLGARVNGRIEMAFSETPYWEVCGGA